MCLNVIRKSRLKLGVAKKDIIVYKKVKIVSKNECQSHVYDYIYTIGKKCPKVKLGIKYNYDKKRKIYYIDINLGYHYFKVGSSELIQTYYNIINGYYKNVYIAEFIIPKGTRYYNKNESNLGVAESIIFNKLLSIKQLQELLYRQ